MSIPFDLILVSLIFLLAGMVKGIIGLGLPTISLGLLVLFVDITTAMTLFLIPSLLTNMWQATVGGNLVYLLKRCWSFYFPATLFIFLGATAISRFDPSSLSTVLGGLLLVYVALNILQVRIQIPTKHERLFGIVFGAVNGVFTGMTGSFVVPGILYLQAIGLSKDRLIQAMGVLFSLSTIGLALALQKSDYLSMEQLTSSCLAVIPAIVGMVIGQKVRGFLSEEQFKKIFFIAISLLGLIIFLK